MPGLGDEPLRLLLITDPLGDAPRDSQTMLQLMGLTQAEARLASRIGHGLSPRDAGSELGITENSARSLLKDIFAKLDIQRQSQLAHLVTRLESV
jgi:DNA-binding CsgD family transcriptional regulator